MKEILETREGIGAYVWVAYSKTPPYLPVAVADTAAELGAMIGTTKNNIMSVWSHFRHGRGKGCRYYRVNSGNGESGGGAMMLLLPKATKSSLVKLTRTKGYEVPAMSQVYFYRNGRARCYAIRWADAQGVSHWAWYSGAGGRPVLMVDKVVLDLTMAEIIHFGMVEDKKVVS